MKKGDIVLVGFPFTDRSGEKNRPALVLFADKTDVIVAFITTKLNRQEKTDIKLEPSITNGLKRVSIVRLSKLITLEKNIVLGKLGELTLAELSIINTSLRHLFSI